MTKGYTNKLGNPPKTYEQAIAHTDAVEAQMRDDEDRKTPEGRERIRLRIEAAKLEISNRSPRLK